MSVVGQIAGLSARGRRRVLREPITQSVHDVLERSPQCEQRGDTKLLQVCDVLVGDDPPKTTMSVASRLRSSSTTAGTGSCARQSEGIDR